MTDRIKYLGVIVVGALTLFSALAMYYTAHANPSLFIRGNSTSASGTCSALTATTSVTYMTAGTATTTYTLDTGCAGAQGSDKAALLVQFAGSSTASTLNGDVQYSQDGVDWYASNLATPLDVTSTSSPALSPVQSLGFVFASSTISRVAVTNANSATSTRMVNLYTPTRWIRVVFYLPSGSTNGATWAEFVAKRQAN